MAKLSFPKEKIKILLLEDVSDIAVKTLHDSGYTNIELKSKALEEEALIEHLQNVRILGIRSRTHVTKRIFDHAPNLMALGCFCIGTNQVDLTQASHLGIPVFNAPHTNTRSVAEIVTGFIIMLLRNIFQKAQAAHQGIWLKSAKGSHEARGKKLGIIGYGNIGSQVSVLAEGLGMHVIYYDIEPKLPLGNARPVHKLDELLETADIVTLHVPDTPLTRHLLNKERLEKMKKGAYLINTSRGSTVDLEALAGCLRSGHIQGAALDVFPDEPSNHSSVFKSPLQGFDNAILTPHIAGSTLEAQDNIAIEVSQKLIDFIDTGSTIGAVNFPKLSLPPNESAHRILHTHQNIPGMLKQVNEIIADKGINIISQYLKTNEDIGYLVLDINQEASKEMIEALKNIPGTIKVRVLY